MEIPTPFETAKALVMATSEGLPDAAEGIVVDALHGAEDNIEYLGAVIVRLVAMIISLAGDAADQQQSTVGEVIQAMREDRDAG